MTKDQVEALVVLFEDHFGESWRWSRNTRQWYKFDGRIWKETEFILDDIMNMTDDEAQRRLLQGRKGVRELGSSQCQFSLRKRLRGRPRLTIEEKDFDADGTLFHTQNALLNLATGDFA